MMNNYSDIINLPRPISKNHKQMSNHDRAAQFAPFAALTGYEQVVKEVSRKTDERIVLSEDEKQIINRYIEYLLEHQKQNFPIKVTYFVKDKKKSGGKYVTKEGLFYSISGDNKKLVFADKTSVLIIDIIEIQIEGVDLSL